MKNKQILAVDFGASSGRSMLCSYDGEKISLREIHRFSNDPVMMHGGFFWDAPRLLHEIKAAILAASHEGGAVSLGIDTWGVDYGYLDKSGVLLSNPYHYRDKRTDDIQPYVFSNFATKKEIYAKTGIQSLNFNTLYQLTADMRDRPWIVENAECLLHMPDLFDYMLTGEKTSEYTIASTGTLLDANKRDYSFDLIEKCGIPTRIFKPIVQPGTKCGVLLPSIEEETGNTGLTVMKVASHDTASAVLSVPAMKKDFLYISSGTWSLMGTETDTPVLTELSEKYDFTNEGGVFGTIRLLKNIMGLWMIQSVRHETGDAYSFAQICDMAEEAKDFSSRVDCNDNCFLAPKNMTEEVKDYCRRTNQQVPETLGELATVIYASLAECYAKTIHEMEAITGRTYGRIHVVGGGANAGYLNQLTANACLRPVYAGPTEATAIGNLTAQMLKAKEFTAVEEARDNIFKSFGVKEYKPE